MIDLPAIRARLEKASPGPWYFDCEWRGESFPNLYRLDCSILDYGMDGEEGIYIRRKEDVDFLNSVRQDIPALLDEVERLTKENEALRRRDGVILVAPGIYADPENLKTLRGCTCDSDSKLPCPHWGRK